jgi:glucose/arabinose dehydrogenase
MKITHVISSSLALVLCQATFAADTDGLVLPKGFEVTVVHEGIGLARHIAIRDNGDFYVSTHQFSFMPFDATKRVGIVALRDTNGDHKADVVQTFDPEFDGTGVKIYQGMLYVSDDVGVYRFHFDGDELVPKQPRETVIGGFPLERTHADKTFTFDNEGHIYVNVGAPTNSCQQQDRAPGSLGRNPCPYLEHYAGIWRFDATKLNQTPADGTRYATGLRNSIALNWNPDVNALYLTMHGRDQIDTIFPNLFSAEDNAELVGEEFHRIVEGANYGWPYTFFSTRLNTRVIAPEYGGDGKRRAQSGKYATPLLVFPAHWAPDDLLFYEGKNFPASYRGGAFIAFHGSWNRAPIAQAGYRVVFVPMKKGKPSGKWQTFADNFTGGPIPDNNPGKARARPVGLAVDGEGALYIVDSQMGRIWRVTYHGR